MYLFDLCMNLMTDKDYDDAELTVKHMIKKLESVDKRSEKQEKELEKLKDILDLIQERMGESIKTSVDLYQLRFGGLKNKKIYTPTKSEKALEEYYMTIQQKSWLDDFLVSMDTFYKKVYDRLTDEEANYFVKEMGYYRDTLDDIKNQEQ